MNASDYVKFHNLKSNNYKRQIIEIDKGSVLSFIRNQDCSVFDFYACAFSLYVSRINRQKGCLLKTNIPSKGAGLKTILKMDLNSDSSFTDYLHQFDSVYGEAISHTKVSIENFMDEDLSYYSVYDFSDLNENICIYNGDGSALTLNIYDGYLEILYNEDLFSDIYIEHMADNIKSLINNVVEFPNHLLKDVNILSDNEEKLISDFCRGEDADVDDDLLVSRYFRRHALENPDAIAIDDGVNQVSYDLEFDKVAFKSFLNKAGISENVFFTSVFSYALSQFVNGNKVIFTIIENGRDRFNENFIGMTSNVMPIVIDCKDQSINSYVGDVADTVYGVLRHSYYPILLLYQKYDFVVDILFQYVPNWIADDFTADIVEIENINADEIYNYILNRFSDFLTELLVQVYQNGDDYTLFITHSNKYSDKMVEDFKNMFITILLNIINADTSSSILSDTLE